MIFSFVFFTGFVFFLFMVLKPQDTSTLSGSVISALYDSFEEEVHTNLSSMFLKANYTVYNGSNEMCFNITLPERIFAYAIVDGNSYVTNLSGVGIDSDLEASGSLEINKNKDNYFFRVSISPEFKDENIATCEPLDDYEIGSLVERRVVSYNALYNMSQRYHLGEYEELRKELKIPAIFDFAIVPDILTSVNMTPQSGIPSSVEVQAQDYVLPVLKKDGTIINERFTLKIW